MCGMRLTASKDTIHYDKDKPQSHIICRRRTKPEGKYRNGAADNAQDQRILPPHAVSKYTHQYAAGTIDTIVDGKKGGPKRRCVAERVRILWQESQGYKVPGRESDGRYSLEYEGRSLRKANVDERGSSRTASRRAYRQGYRQRNGQVDETECSKRPSDPQAL